jgi:hypothetical protein
LPEVVATREAICDKVLMRGQRSVAKQKDKDYLLEYFGKDK